MSVSLAINTRFAALFRPPHYQALYGSLTPPLFLTPVIYVIALVPRLVDPPTEWNIKQRTQETVLPARWFTHWGRLGGATETTGSRATHYSKLPGAVQALSPAFSLVNAAVFSQTALQSSSLDSPSPPTIASLPWTPSPYLKHTQARVCGGELWVWIGAVPMTENGCVLGRMGAPPVCRLGMFWCIEHNIAAPLIERGERRGLNRSSCIAVQCMGREEGVEGSSVAGDIGEGEEHVQVRQWEGWER